MKYVKNAKSFSFFFFKKKHFWSYLESFHLPEIVLDRGEGLQLTLIKDHIYFYVEVLFKLNLIS